jgi:DnaK suppressor protein
MLVDDDLNWHCVMPIWVALHRIERIGQQSDRMDCDRMLLALDKIGGHIVKTEEYKQILLVKEKEMLQQMGREGTTARESSDEEVHSWGDQSATDAGRAEEFGVADVDWTTLRQVQDALKRIEAGTFGSCFVDHRPISEKRLKGVPWARYCLKHQQELELKASIKTPTL